MRTTLLATVAFGVCTARTFAGEGKSAAWPQGRGPNRDGVVQGVKAPAKWPRKLTEEWRVEVGEGIASPVVAGGKVYVFTRRKEQEVVACFDVASGEEQWQSKPYPAPFKPHPPATAYGKYPRSTPAVADGRVFTLGVSGIFSCLDARTGKLLWRKDFSRQPPVYGYCNSPLVAGGLCIVHVGDGDGGKGGLTAFDVRTGAVKWRYADGSGPAYGSPILVTLAGERQVVTLTTGNFLGVSAATGKLLWRVEGSFAGNDQCLTPVRYKDLPCRSCRPRRLPWRPSRSPPGSARRPSGPSSGRFNDTARSPRKPRRGVEVGKRLRTTSPPTRREDGSPGARARSPTWATRHEAYALITPPPSLLLS
jgi:hypothetical protein